MSLANFIVVMLHCWGWFSVIVESNCDIFTHDKEHEPFYSVWPYNDVYSYSLNVHLFVIVCFWLWPIIVFFKERHVWVGNVPGKYEILMEWNMNASVYQGIWVVVVGFLLVSKCVLDAYLLVSQLTKIMPLKKEMKTW